MCHGCCFLLLELVKWWAQAPGARCRQAREGRPPGASGLRAYLGTARVISRVGVPRHDARRTAESI
ncbi:hypothetical protein BSLA_01r1992 [Burkholderia stabilis]|nr:hypothetical protein BSLA_01r1992 [Burkholderia stabilis]